MCGDSLCTISGIRSPRPPHRQVARRALLTGAGVGLAGVALAGALPEAARAGEQLLAPRVLSSNWEQVRR